MIGRIVFLAALLSFSVRADESDMRQLLDLMEAGNPASSVESAPEVTSDPLPAVEPVPESVPVKSVKVPATGGPLDMEDAVSLATVNDARLAPYSMALKMAQYRNEASLQRDNPELRLGTDVGSADPDMRASVRFFPLHPWEANALKRENSALVEEEAAAFRSAVLGTTIETMTLYHELQCLEMEKTLYGQLADIKQQTAERMERQVAAAVGTQAQGLLAYWEARETLDNRRNAEIESAQLKQSLAALIGRPVGQFSVAVLDADAGFTLLDEELPTHAALGNRPELQLLRAQRAAADARLRGVKAADIPWLNHVEVGYRNNSGGWALEAAIDLPFFSIGGTDKMLAYEELSLREIEVETGEQLIRLQVVAAVQAYNVAVNEWNSLLAGQRTLMEKTRTFLDSTPSDNPQQMADRMALEEKLIRAEFKMLDVRRNVHKALMELIAIVGKPI